MKSKHIISSVVLVPLVVVTVLAFIGVILSFWVYLLLSVMCILAAGTTWYLYKDMENKISNAKKGKFEK